jgi:galactose mutarotase-like enzyme
MRLTHADLSEEITYYPYRFHASIEVDMLNENTMQYKLYIKNTDDRPLPVSPGLHPYWSVSHMQKRNVILSGLTGLDPSHIDWDINPPDTDYAFGTTVSLQTDRYQLHIVRDGGEIPLTQITVWSQPISTIDRDFICVEPIAGMRGGYVSAPHIIPAGSTHRMCVKFIVTEEHL